MYEMYATETRYLAFVRNLVDSATIGVLQDEMRRASATTRPLRRRRRWWRRMLRDELTGRERRSRSRRVLDITEECGVLS